MCFALALGPAQHIKQGTLYMDGGTLYVGILGVRYFVYGDFGLYIDFTPHSPYGKSISQTHPP